ncbi:SDR family oxidoreductase [Aurantiacibacter zhengii]|uniref:SDR family oxidoreductase n=1 Tax=Aurantiacibacter zhengii TaxID=2307003 RepID=A0A418NV41_9SPHN|nr:SDR family oxidoreductase [Aurantiacibacter zhengii]RIV87901.1 SDR family oxidoreductase [Aurantiacibacter zhengii]
MKIDSGISAVVTGGASGLGEATARALAAKGAKVALFDLNEERGEDVARQIGGVFCRVNVSDEESVAAGFAKAREAHGQERVLVNCAGVATVGKLTRRDRETGAVSKLPLDQFAKAIQVNLMGTFACMAEAAAGMMALDPIDDSGERGVIINTASVAAEDGQIGQVAYAASKAGVKGMTLPVARDLMNEGIRVNAILPGIFMTPMMAGLPEKAQESLAASVPFPKRLGQPEEYADLACFMVEAEYMNAECVRLDGAIRMPPK